MGKVVHLAQARHADIVNTGRLGEGDFVSTFPAEAASAVSEFGQDEQQQPSTSLWTRMVRAMRAWWIRQGETP